MPTKLFEETQTDSTSGKFEAFADAKDDAADLAHTSRFLHISAAGNVHVTSENGDEVTVPVSVGRADLRIQRLWATGTTADGIVCY